MSGSESESDDAVGRREVAWRVFAAEFDDADFSYAESDEERAPNYVVTPTGARVNRMFVVGVLTEVEQVSDDVLRARIVDPTGAFVVYAGQYQPDALAFLESADVPAFVAVTGKARTFQPEDSDLVYTSVRPESINAVDAETRDRWTVRTAEQTVERVGTMADALDSEERGETLRDALVAAGVRPDLAAGVPLAIDHYGTTETYLEAVRDLSVEAAEVVAGERDEVSGLDVTPAEGGPVDADLGANLDFGAAAEPETSEPSRNPRK
ncbi:RPA family protein [Halospeciosus flavus]